MDLQLRQLLNRYQVAPSHELAAQIATVILRTETLQDLEQRHYSGDSEVSKKLLLTIWHGLYPEIYPLFPIMEQPYPSARTWAFYEQGVDGRYTLPVYVNVRCEDIPVASIECQELDEVISAVTFCRSYFQKLKLLMYPKPLTLTTIQREQFIFAPSFRPIEGYRNFVIAAEVGACFNFEAESAPPFIPYRHRETQGALRPLTEEDYVDTSFDDIPRQPTIKQLDYRELPDFCKANLTSAGFELAPAFITVSEVTRESHNDIDGPAWYNFFRPISRLYVGFILNGLQETHSEQRLPLWEFIYGGYQYKCHQCGREEFSEERWSRNRCRACGNEDVDRRIASPLRIQIRSEIENPEPELAVPEHINQALAFLQSISDWQARGDIYSVNGGVDISLSLEEPSIYGPLKD